MSAYRFVTLTCDTCGEVWESATTNFVREARRISRREGWMGFHGQDFCPKCWRSQVSEATR